LGKFERFVSFKRRRHEKLNRVAVFINKHGDLFPERSVAREAANQILSILAGLNERAKTRQWASVMRGSRRNKKRSRLWHTNT
jgi:hypothetical protein